MVHGKPMCGGFHVIPWLSRFLVASRDVAAFESVGLRVINPWVCIG